MTVIDVEARAAEVEALTNAKAVLSGASFSLLQVSSSNLAVRVIRKHWVATPQFWVPTPQFWVQTHPKRLITVYS